MDSSTMACEVKDYEVRSSARVLKVKGEVKEDSWRLQNLLQTGYVSVLYQDV